MNAKKVSWMVSTTASASASKRANVTDTTSTTTNTTANTAANTMANTMWWENGVIPPPHRTVFRRADAVRHASLTIFFARALSTRAPLYSLHHALLTAHVSLHNRFSSPVSLQHRFFNVFLNSCLYILDLDRNSNISLSLCSHVLPTLLVSRTSTNAAFISCKCVNSLFHHNDGKHDGKND